MQVPQLKHCHAPGNKAPIHPLCRSLCYCFLVLQLAIASKKIFDEYLADSAPHLINIDDIVKKSVKAKMDTPTSALFDEAQKDVCIIVYMYTHVKLQVHVWYSIPDPNQISTSYRARLYEINTVLKCMLRVCIYVHGTRDSCMNFPGCEGFFLFDETNIFRNMVKHNTLYCMYQCICACTVYTVCMCISVMLCECISTCIMSRFIIDVPHGK